CSPVAFAQSTISGQVRDSSGAVMAGVTVEAASPALIERSRTVTTDGEGRYAVVDVRPGPYTMTFTMSGFSQVKQQVDVPSNVTVPVDASMQVGAVGQTVEVQAQVATVDVENVAHPEVLSRSDMDALPTARNMQSIGSYVPGVHLNNPDVGGTQQIEQTYMSTHGNPPGRDTYLLDGMRVNTMQLDGYIQIYIDNEVLQESTYQTSNVTAEVQAGGVYTNLIPKDGGNDFHGALFLGYTPAQFVGSNITQGLIARGVTGQSAVNRIEDFDGSVGGPILKDKLWFLLGGRKQLTFIQAANSFYLNGQPGIERSYIYTGDLRLTYQLNSKNKFAAMWIRDWKTKENDVVTDAGGYSDVNPAVSTLERMPKMYYILQTRWTGTLTPKLILQSGLSLTKLDYNINDHPGQQLTPFSQAWYAGASELDLGRLTRSVSQNVQTFAKYDRFVWNATGAYITGSHQIKFGVSDDWGIDQLNNLANGDANYNYLNGVPLSITAYNTPTYQKFRLKSDLGIYGVDTWHIKRLAITGGLRWEYLNNFIEKQSAPAGRFVGPRQFPQVDCGTVKGLSCFKNWAPRLGVIYDVFGNHKTAVKAGVGKYDTPIVTSNLNAFNPMYTASQSIPWLNAPTTACETDGKTPGCIPAGTTFGTGDIGPNPNPRFGLLNNISIDPNFHREYQWEYSIGVQHEIRQGLTLNFGWNRTADYQQPLLINYAVPPSAYTPFQIANPLDGSALTVYNLQPAYFGLVPELHETNAPQSLRRNVYNGFETSVSGRLPHGAFIFAGWTLENQTDVACDINTSFAGSALNDPNSLHFCDQTGGLYQNLGKISGVPWRNEFKLQGNLPIKWGFEVNASVYSDPVYSAQYSTPNAAGLTAFSAQEFGFKTVNWSITPGTRYPKDCNCPDPGGLVDPGLKQGSALIQLIPPGSRLTPRLTQFDMGARRVFHIHERFTILPEIQVFNILNASTVLQESETLGPTVKPYLPGAPGGTPSVILNPRMFRLSLQFKF
ncbi:MAG TPA: TonB-dependent receptor, partial [Bryobacteraceae bacterium]|nr:TonB-dependent receptor [Bryobacteraceae bacterium]